MPKRTKIAFVCGFDILTPNKNAGDARIVYFAHELSKRFDVRVVQVCLKQITIQEYTIHPFLHVINVEPSFAFMEGWRKTEESVKPLFSLDYFHYLYKNLLNDESYVSAMTAALDGVEVAECYWFYPTLVKPLTKAYVCMHHPDVYYDMACQEVEMSYDEENAGVETEQYSDADKKRYTDEVFATEKTACEAADAITAMTREDADRFTELYGVSAEKISIVPVIYDFGQTAFVRPGLRPKSEAYDLRVLFISNVHYSSLYAARKVLEFSRQLPNVEFHFVGMICKTIDKLGTGPNVRSHGYLPNEQYDSLLSSSIDLAISVITQTYGMSTKNLDFFSAGVPIIANEAAMRGFDFPGEGYYFRADWDNFTQRIQAFISVPMEERDAMAQRAYQYAKETFSSRAVSARLVNGWRKLGFLGEKAGVYLFGSGHVGVNALNSYTYEGIRVEGFIDNDERRHGEMMHGIEVFSLGHLLKMQNRPEVVISVADSSKLFFQLLNCGYPLEKISIFENEEFPGSVDCSLLLNAYAKLEGKPKAVLYGAGGGYRNFRDRLFEKYNVVAVVDGDEKRQGKLTAEGLVISSPDILEWIPYDEIVVTPQGAAVQEIYQVLLSRGIKSKNITTVGKLFEDAIGPWMIDPRFFFSNLTLPEKQALFARNVERVCLELNSKCNRQCWFCCNAVVDRHSENHLMSDALFEKITDELASIGYDGDFSLCLYNEPLLRDDLDKKVAAIKAKMPQSLVYTFINGDYLNPEWLSRLAKAGMDTLYVDIYMQNTPKTPFGTEAIKQRMNELAAKLGLAQPVPESASCDHIFAGVMAPGNLYVCFVANDMTVHAGNRGEMLMGLPGIPPRQHPKMCIKNFISIHIDYLGNMWPCPNFIYEHEPHKQYIMGNLAEENIFDIYMGEKMTEWRKLNMFQRESLPCRSCKWNWECFVTQTPAREYRSRPAERRPPLISTL